MMTSAPNAKATRSGQGNKGAMESLNWVIGLSLSWRDQPVLGRRSRRTRLQTQPFENIAGMHLVGLVVAGQRVHHQIDTTAQGELTRSLAA